MTDTSNAQMDQWIRSQGSPNSARVTKKLTARARAAEDAATDIQWLRRLSGLIVEPGPDADGVTR